MCVCVCVCLCGSLWVCVCVSLSLCESLSLSFFHSLIKHNTCQHCPNTKQISVFLSKPPKDTHVSNTWRPCQGQEVVFFAYFPPLDFLSFTLVHPFSLSLCPLFAGLRHTLQHVISLVPYFWTPLHYIRITHTLSLSVSLILTLLFFQTGWLQHGERCVLRKAIPSARGEQTHTHKHTYTQTHTHTHRDSQVQTWWTNTDSKRQAHGCHRGDGLSQHWASP